MLRGILTYIVAKEKSQPDSTRASHLFSSDEWLVDQNTYLLAASCIWGDACSTRRLENCSNSILTASEQPNGLSGSITWKKREEIPHLTEYRKTIQCVCQAAHFCINQHQWKMLTCKTISWASDTSNKSRLPYIWMVNVHCIVFHSGEIEMVYK